MNQGKERTGHLNVLNVKLAAKAGLPKGRESYGDGVLIVVRRRESRLHGEGAILERE